MGLLTSKLHFLSHLQRLVGIRFSLHGVLSVHVILLTLTCSLGGDTPIVKTTKGSISGKWVGSIAAFLGVPYATPPINRLRFKKPTPVRGWNFTLPTEHYSAGCKQMWLKPPLPRSSDDCLYLNVFTPTLDKQEPLPVLVWFHGGGYEVGSGADFPESAMAELASSGIIIVSPNYRLNFFGFFTTLTDDFPANLGLFDQFAVLEWVKAEIGLFGGDAGRVSVGGQGTGAAMASLHTYSPLSKGLFNGVILQSGSALTPFAVAGNRYDLESSRVLAVELGCISEEEWRNGTFGMSFQSCIYNTPVKEIWGAWRKGFSSGASYDPSFQRVWAPVVDGPGGFLPQSPQLMSERDRNLTGIKVIIGSTTDERAQLVISKVRNDNRSVKSFVESDFDRMIGSLARPEVFPGKFRVMRDLVKFVYTQQMPLKEGDFLGWINAIVQSSSDYWMNSGVLSEAQRLRTSGAEVFLYSFDYVSPGANKQLPYNSVPHGIDLLFLFPGVPRFLRDLGLIPWEYGNEDQRISHLLRTLWTNFIKTGSPNNPEDILHAHWQPLNAERPDGHLRILTRPVMTDNFHTYGANLWRNVVPPLLQLPYCDTKAQLVLEEQEREEQSLEVKQGRDGIYHTMTWVLVAILIVSLIIFTIILLHYKRRLRSYNLLRRVEDLNFT